MTGSHRDVVRKQFTRAAAVFAERSEGRFDALGVVEFSRFLPGQTIVEVGAGTGHFISLFAASAALSVAVDLTEAMLAEARSRYDDLHLVAADGSRLPFRSRSFDLVATAQALHHIWTPVDILRELRRVARPEGRVLVVDSVASDRYEEAERMNELDRIRDPSHAAFRSPGTMRTLVQAAGLSIIDEAMTSERQRLSNWMWPGEFEEARSDKVRSFIEVHGHETGMGFERDGDDYSFERRRMMLLCRRP